MAQHSRELAAEESGPKKTKLSPVETATQNHGPKVGTSNIAQLEGTLGFTCLISPVEMRTPMPLMGTTQPASLRT